MPEPQRTSLVRRLGGNPAWASFLLGVVELPAGILLVYDSAMGFLVAFADRAASVFVELANHHVPTRSEALGFTWSGAVLWLGWLLRPTTWLLIALPVVGLLRIVAFMTTGEAVAEPTVWAAVRAAGWLRRGAIALGVRSRFGPAQQPDEAVRLNGGGWLIFTARERPEWNDAVTVGIGDRYFRLAEHDVVERQGARRHRYRLAEAGEHEVIRRFLLYEPPKPPTAPAS